MRDADAGADSYPGTHSDGDTSCADTDSHRDSSSNKSHTYSSSADAHTYVDSPTNGYARPNGNANDRDAAP